MLSYRTYIVRGLLGLGLVCGLGSLARADGLLRAHREAYEATHPFVNLTTSREWFAHPTERTPCGMNGWGQRYRSMQVYMLYLNSTTGPGPTQRTCQEALGSNWPLKRPIGPFPPAHAVVKPLEFEKDIAEDN